MENRKIVINEELVVAKIFDTYKLLIVDNEKIKFDFNITDDDILELSKNNAHVLNAYDLYGNKYEVIYDYLCSDPISKKRIYEYYLGDKKLMPLYKCLKPVNNFECYKNDKINLDEALYLEKHINLQLKKDEMEM